MWRDRSKAFRRAVLSTLIFASISLFADEGERLFVVPAKITLLQQPQVKSAKVTTVSRGQQVDVLERKDLWYFIDYKGKKGWVPKVALSSQKPVGKADIVKDVPVSLEKSSRTRSSASSVTAATRGVLGKGEDVDADKVDRKAVQEMEATKISPQELEKFRSSAKLPTD